ncbi:phosphatidylinositol 3 [Apiospora hydei]|uniref:1-phosphatidylinositol 4-kinase n=1 Tax=Apiospora hydei TaxID=1337664 RepID=A0ABR1WYC7_9PEZI
MIRDIRQQALQKIALLSATSPATSFDKTDLDRLCRATNGHARGKEVVNGAHSLSRVPMTIREFEVLLALCKAAPLVHTSQSAQKLVNQLIPCSSVSWGKYDDLHETVSDNVWAFLAAMKSAVNSVVPSEPDEDGEQNLDDAIRTATIAIALLGFLDAASAQTDFWRSGGRLALIQRVRDLLSANFLTAVEGAFSSIRNAHASDRNAKEWKRYLKHYAAKGRPLSADLLQRSFMWLLVSATSLLSADAKVLRGANILDLFMSKDMLRSGTSSPDADFRSLETYATIASEEMDRVEQGADFVSMGSMSQQKLAYAVKASAMISFLNCSMLNEDAADPEILMGWLEESLLDPIQMLDETLASAVLRCMAVICRLDSGYASKVSRLLPRFIVQTVPRGDIVATASTCLAFVLQMLSHDAVITTLYTLGNVLSPTAEQGAASGFGNELTADSAVPNGIYQAGKHSTGSSISLALQEGEDTSAVYENIVQTICGIASKCNDEKITALAQAMLLQKLTKLNQSVDSQIIMGAAMLSLSGGQLEFRSLIRLFSKICRSALEDDKEAILVAVVKARNYISANVKLGSPLFDIYLTSMLEELVSKGDVQHSSRTKESDIEFSAREIAQLLQPLSILLSTNDFAAAQKTDDESHSMIRDAWFNIVVHGFNPASDRESLRAESGDCTKALSYFLEPSMHRTEVSSVMEGITTAVMERYLSKTIEGKLATFSAQYAASQLATVFCGCCHRIQRVQQAAFACADKIIREVPSALCQRSSLFALLELLSLMWTSCLEAETELYDPRSIFSSKLGNVTVELSDDYTFRKYTLNRLYTKAKAWVPSAINLAPADVKGLLQTYLSEFNDELAYGHMSLGRSFAMEIGSSIPSTDQRLTSLNPVGDTTINTTSDFIAQYTTRQEYRYGEALPDHGMDLLNVMPLGRRASFIKAPPHETASAINALAHLESRLATRKNTPVNEIRDILRRAAALLCRTEKDESAVAHYLVSLPFTIFSKESLKLGVSLWLGVMNENPRMESRLLAEIVQQWEFTINNRVGLFNPALMHPDPFFLREEFAPSDNEALTKRRHMVHNLLAPHARLVQFFNSHFNATRLGSPDTQRIFLRMLDLTLDAMKLSVSHPMARELNLNIVLFSFRVLKACTGISNLTQWRLKDKILSAGLNWFSHSPKWSFGSNILQLKTEMRLISDVMAAMKGVGYIAAHSVGSYQGLAPKEQLFHLLLESEQARLNVWVHPVSDARVPKTDLMTSNGQRAAESALLPLVRTAWAENPSLAIELVSRYSFASVRNEVRSLLLNFPEKAIHEPEALPVLLGGDLPNDIRSQLKYLMYWAPVNPVTSVTYFLPAYRNHPFLIQYAMRALEDHPVDVTFFYVPQIVQALRYDALGYVERYIIETAQFSQLFAHQIIWNMKANSYKDDDGTVPDEIKPALDKVMDSMIDSFSPEDKAFYEKEFGFFAEVTGISGKLKPLIKAMKDVKKQKIEEELRQIKVEVGVYLPSNPDGVVIGIDRKSGKPLQSHAKAPFMATFRIKKPKTDDVEDTEEVIQGVSNTGLMSNENTIETWQSAIFKVGDDCRQDVLALQMIAAFRGIFHNVGLDVYVFPYRVTATAPGCGVIDVLPNSVSRDMLGREAVNGLYDYFVSKYGNEDSLRFQKARNNFVKSMAAYSIISFLLQFKDRHNGNIMIDGEGHILHIDFGFCFDIAPGGVKFERAPFKLTSEMLAVMGGSMDHQSFKWFEELCVKAFLAARPFAEKLSQIVLLMMDSGLPLLQARKCPPLQAALRPRQERARGRRLCPRPRPPQRRQLVHGRL